MSLDSRLKFGSIFLLIVLGEVVTQSVDSPRLRNGQIVDSLKRFPHHVTIETVGSWEQENRLCGGTILSEQWILTSGLCVDQSDLLKLHFEKLYYNSFNGSFTIVVNKDEVYMHPTFYYDIALIHIPVQLVFSDNLKPVTLSSSPVNQLEGRLAVMPGFEVQRAPALTTTTTTTTTTTPTTPTTTTTTTSAPEGTVDPTEYYGSTSISRESDLDELRRFSSFDKPKQLGYGMFRVLSNRRCRSIDSTFDEFLQICTENWVTSSDSSSCWNYGNGLLVGWPGKTELIGIYSVLLNNCNSSRPAVYTNIAEYLPWIESVIDIPP